MTKSLFAGRYHLVSHPDGPYPSTLATAPQLKALRGDIDRLHPEFEGWVVRDTLRGQEIPAQVVRGILASL